MAVGRGGRVPHRPELHQRPGAGAATRSCSATRRRAWWSRVGPGVTAVAVGDHVICSIIGPCEHCFQCLRDDHALCEDAPFFTGTMLDGTTRLSKGGTPIHTLHYQGSYAEYAIVPERFVVPIRDDAPLDVVCGLACGASHRTRCGDRCAPRCSPGSSVVVVGAGGVGLSTMMGARFRGATTIVAVDRLAAQGREGARARARHPRRRRVDRPTRWPRCSSSPTGGAPTTASTPRASPARSTRSWPRTRPGATCVVIGRALGAVDRDPRHHRAAAPAGAHRHLRRVDPPPPAPPRVRRPVHGRAGSTSARSSTAGTRSTRPRRRSTTCTTAG